jgi:hypothetical protein
VYSTNPSTNSQPRFGQTDPSHYCPHRHSPIYAQDGYTAKHRCPRCSKQCHQAWASKEHASTVHYLDKHLPKTCTVFRGHLHLPKGATVQDHKHARERFIANLRKWKCVRRKKAPVILELRAYTHVHAPDAQHYDYVLYSDLPEDALRPLIRRLWTNAGGREDIALVAIDAQDYGELANMVGYLAKTEARHRTRFYLPADTGLGFVWGTHFYTAESLADVCGTT